MHNGVMVKDCLNGEVIAYRTPGIRVEVGLTGMKIGPLYYSDEEEEHTIMDADDIMRFYTIEPLKRLYTYAMGAPTDSIDALVREQIKKLLLEKENA